MYTLILKFKEEPGRGVMLEIAGGFDQPEPTEPEKISAATAVKGAQITLEVLAQHLREGNPPPNAGAMFDTLRKEAARRMNPEN